jgi:hypothetical protein
LARNVSGNFAGNARVRNGDHGADAAPSSAIPCATKSA